MEPAFFSDFISNNYEQFMGRMQATFSNPAATLHSFSIERVAGIPIDDTIHTTINNTKRAQFNAPLDYYGRVRLLKAKGGQELSAAGNTASNMSADNIQKCEILKMILQQPDDSEIMQKAMKAFESDFDDYNALFEDCTKAISARFADNQPPQVPFNCTIVVKYALRTDIQKMISAVFNGSFIQTVSQDPQEEKQG